MRIAPIRFALQPAQPSGRVSRAHPEHEQALAAANACGLLVLSAMTITEVHQVATIRADREAADAIVATLTARAEQTRVAIAATTPRLLRTALADAAVVALAAEYRTDAVLTLDRRDSGRSDR